MKIIFNLMGCGLGNNGGSRTIVRSANTLIDLGHEVFVIDSFKNKYTWDKLKAEHITLKHLSDAPSADVIIATGYKTVYSTVDAPERCGKKAHWIRGWETWQMSEEKIINNVLKAPTIKMVNGIGLQKKLEKYGISSRVIRPGYDFDEIYPMGIRENNSSVVLGGLCNFRHKTKRTDWIYEVYKQLKRKYNVELHLFGTEKDPRIKADRYLRNPTTEMKNDFYNRCDIWLAPTHNEGLHMPPAEAMMTECPVVGTDAEMSGMEDYLIDGITGLIAKNNLDQFSRVVSHLVTNGYLRTVLGAQAKLQISSIGNRSLNMKIMVDFLQYENIQY